MDTYGFKFNPYDPCVANKITEGEPLTLVFHVDDIKASHKDKNVLENFKQWIDRIYIYPNIGKIKPARGNIHEYLSTTLYYTTKLEVKTNMHKYVKKYWWISDTYRRISGRKNPGNQKTIEGERK